MGSLGTGLDFTDKPYSPGYTQPMSDIYMNQYTWKRFLIHMHMHTYTPHTHTQWLFTVYIGGLQRPWTDTFQRSGVMFFSDSPSPPPHTAERQNSLNPPTLTHSLASPPSSSYSQPQGTSPYTSQTPFHGREIA